MKAYFAMFAAYNRWANARLYEAAAKLSPADYFADRGAFFGSLHGTLNHILVGDRIWMGRFVGTPSHHTRLNESACEDLASLTAARRAEDDRIVRYIEERTEEDFGSVISFLPVTNPVETRQVLQDALAHFFNHQAHHRGQAHVLLSIAGGFPNAAPALDLVLFQRSVRA
jgi:uncharacterized damage-inducible protein DinB